MFFHAENYEIKIKFVFNCVQKSNIIKKKIRMKYFEIV
jgi:hypothetical protein